MKIQNNAEVGLRLLEPLRSCACDSETAVIVVVFDEDIRKVPRWLEQHALVENSGVHGMVLVFVSVIALPLAGLLLALGIWTCDACVFPPSLFMTLL